MSDISEGASGPPAESGPPSAPPGAGAAGETSGDEPEAKPNRAWFVVLAWITMILFGIFVATITICAILIPRLRDGAQG